MTKPYFWGKTSPLLTHPPLTDTVIQQAQSELGYKLPAAYLNILRKQNGGYINYNGFPAPDNHAWESVILVDHILGIGADVGILDTPMLLEIWQMPAELVLFSGDGNYWLAMDYRGCLDCAEPAITYFDNQYPNEQGRAEFPLTNSFAAFLAGLVLGEPDYIWGIHAPDIKVRELVQQVNQCCALDIQPQVNPETGEKMLLYFHPTWRAAWSGEQARFLLYPNKAYRDSGGAAFPMYPEYNWLLSCDLLDNDLASDLFQQLESCLVHPIKKINTPLPHKLLDQTDTDNIDSR